MPKWVMILNDGETYTNLDGCAIVAVPEEMPDDEVEDFVRHADGYYCFSDEPPVGMVPNNGQTWADTLELDREYYKENWRSIDNVTTPWGPRKGL